MSSSKTPAFNISFQIEAFPDLIDEGRHLAEQNFDELETHNPGAEFNITFYSAMYDTGMMRCLTIRDEGELVGYCLVFMADDPQCQGQITGSVDAIYVAPEYRRFDVSRRFFKFIEAAMKQNGVTYIKTASRPNRDISSFLKYMGYSEVETIYRKDI